MSTQADRSPWLSLDLAAGIGLYLLTLFGELCVAALIRWPLVYLGVALVKPFLPFSPDPSHLAWTAVLGPLCWSLLGLVLPGRGSLWGRRLGARRPSVEEKDAIADAMGQLRQVDPALPDPPRFLVIDDPIPTAAVRGLTVLLGRAMVELDSLPADLDPDAGVGVASGAQRVRWAEVASDQPALVGGRVITVAAAVSTQRLPIYLAVTVRHESRRGLALVGYPSFVGAPMIDRDPGAEDRSSVEDPVLLAVVGRALRNYLAGSIPNLEADLARGAQVTLPTVALRVQHVGPVEWIGGTGSGAVLAGLTAVDARGTAYELAYEVGIAERERPYVDFIAVIPTAS